MSEYYDQPEVARAYDEEVESRGLFQREDVAYYVGLAQRAQSEGQRTLELACGTGRVAIPIADAGCQVTGIDLSQQMLGIAMAKTAGRDNPSWQLADMASFRLEERFGLAIIPARSFHLLMSTAQQVSCLECVRDHLVEGGRLGFNIFNPDLAAMAGWLGEKRDVWQRSVIGANVVRLAQRMYLTAEQEMIETRVDTHRDASGAEVATYRHELRLRYIYRYEMEHLLARCGFEVESLRGGFKDEPFDDLSPEMVWLARKR